MIDLTLVPTNPGCYIYKNKKGQIIYVGKAKNLKKRVTSYFQKRDHDPKTKVLVSNIDSVDFIVTNTEVEALLLENTLIKKHTPKYNIDLKDSKRYAYIRLTDEKFPRLVIAREKTSKGTYFGPFISGKERDYVLQILRKTFQLRTCKRMPKKPCLRYHIKLCEAPCVDYISEEDYMKKIDEVKSILKGKYKELVNSLNNQMSDLSDRQEFEAALNLRNKIFAVEKLTERQNMERHRKINEDIINYEIKDDKVYLILFNIYKGTLNNKSEYIFDLENNFLNKFITQYYDDNPTPKEIILPDKVGEDVQEFLNHKRGSNVILTIPKIGEKKQLLELVKKNIEITFFGHLKKVEELKKQLRLNDMPYVIECFDISHLSGTSTVASMVQFRNGKPDNSNYRRFKIRTVDGIDDFSSMNEVVGRRYKRLRDEGKDFPDLIIVDGGKGQLSAAMKILKDLGLKVPMISLAKREEEVFFPGLSQPLLLDKKNEGLKLLQQIRDEAHRFAITYNRLLRSKKLKDEFKDL